MDFRVDSGDKELENHLATSAKNAMYCSSTTQNQIISCCAKVIQQKIIGEVKAARFFSIIADEASDASNKEQLSLCLRYVNEVGAIKEEFIRFIECEKVDAESLVSYITENLKELSLSLADVRGQGYDGAGCMAGQKAGVSTRILKENHKAIYFHCSSHRLNLVIATCSNVRGVKKMMDAISKLSQTFHFSPKKQELLCENIKETMPDESRKKLLDVCRTRWVQRLDALERIQDLIKPILITLNAIAENHDGSYKKEARQDANGLYSNLKTFSSAVHFIITRHVISYMVPITFELQKTQLDVISVYRAVDVVLASLEECRKNVDEKHKEWYEEAVSYADEYLDAAPKIQRKPGQSTLRENYSSDDPEEYYKLACTIPLLDQITAEIRSRFSNQHRIHADGNFIIPAEVLSKDSWMSHIIKFAESYNDDLPQPMNLSTELHEWAVFWKAEKMEKRFVPTTVAETLLFLGEKRWFPNIRVILCLIAVVPASSNSCERSISRLRLIKNYLRSTMTSERLSDLALMSIHRNIELDPEKVLDIFSTDYSHRLLLL